jgi:hypothetical protein
LSAFFISLTTSDRTPLRNFTTVEDSDKRT